MFLTKIELDPGRRLARKYLGSPQVMHAVVLRATGGSSGDGPGRVLWRLDRGPGTTLYIVSPAEPDCSQLEVEAGVEGVSARSLDYDPFLRQLAPGQRWAFRLAANPSHSVSQGPGVRGKRYGHVTAEQQRQWLTTRSRSLGFDLNPPGGEGENIPLLVVNRERPVFGRANPDRGQRDRVTINRTVYEGVLTVTDADALRAALVSGVGRSKAYGCGLMTLARVIGR